MNDRTAKALLAFTLVLGCHPGALAAGEPKKATMTEGDKVFELVPRLTQGRPFRKDAVERITGLALQQDPTVSNPYFQVFRSLPYAEGPLRSVELRSPVQPQPGKEGMVILALNPKTCVTQQAVIGRFGKDAEPMPPSPHGRRDALTYLRYHQPWGDLRFGFASSGERCLSAIVLDANR